VSLRQFGGLLPVLDAVGGSAVFRNHLIDLPSRAVHVAYTPVLGSECRGVKASFSAISCSKRAFLLCYLRNFTEVLDLIWLDLGDERVPVERRFGCGGGRILLAIHRHFPQNVTLSS
jgi:hypothetical protein